MIEAITEDLDQKLEMWRELDGIVKDDAFFATNTSSLSVADQAACDRAAPSASSACTSSTPRR